MLTRRALVPFFVLSFAIAWGIIAAYLLAPDFMAVFGPLTGNHPLFFLATYAPAIAALSIVMARTGVAGLRSFLGRLLLWRCSWGWLVFLVIGLPLVFYAGFFIKGQQLDDPFPFPSLAGYLVAALLMAVKGPVEELGWRGLALPLLQRGMAPFWAALLLGAIWGLWHLPAFWLSGTPQSAWSFTPFFVGAVAISVIVTAMFNQTGGSILLPAFFHFQLINPLWPDAQPYDTYLLVVIAGLVVWSDRKAQFSNTAGLTDVVPGLAGKHRED